MSTRQVLRWKTAAVPSGALPVAVVVPGLKDAVEGQVKENSCWAASIVACLKVIKGLTELKQCHLQVQFIEDCKPELCAKDDCDKPREVGFVLQSLRTGAKPALGGIFSPRPPGELIAIQDMIRSEAAAVCEMEKHARILYGFMPDDAILLIADPAKPKSASDDVSFFRFENDCWQYFIIRR